MAQRGNGPASTVVVRFAFHGHVPEQEADAVAATLRHLGTLTRPGEAMVWTLAVDREESRPAAKRRLIYLEREGFLRWQETGPG